jgi:peptidoglycan/LPS O-acetylase OafA/YrhL
MTLLREFQDAFRRRPGAARVEVADGLRAVASIWVIGLHTLSLAGSFWIPEDRDVHVFDRAGFSAFIGHPLVRVLSKGDMAVDLFFVLSGFLIATGLLREVRVSGTVAVGRFYKNRFFRLFPAYLVTMALFAALGHGSAANVWANVLYVNNFLPTYDQFMLHAWSLAVEEQFYLLFPLVLLAASQALGARLRAAEGARLWLGLVALGLVVRLIVVQSHELWLHAAASPIIDRDACAIFNDALYDKLYTRYGAIGCGILAAHWNENGAAQRFFTRGGARVWVAFIFAVLAMVVVCSPSPVAPAADPRAGEDGVVVGFLVLYQTLFAAAGAFILLACMHGWRGTRPLARLLGAPFWYPLAQLSYGAYLLHPLIIELVYLRFPPRTPSPLVAFGYFGAFAVLAFAAAVPLHLFVERRGMRARDRLIRAEPAAVAEVGQ